MGHDWIDFPHPRYRPQIAFLIQMLVCTWARPAPVVISSAYADENDSFRYKIGILRLVFAGLNAPNLTSGFRATLIRGSDGLELALKIKLRLAKGRRNFLRWGDQSSVLIQCSWLRENRCSTVTLHDGRNSRRQCSITLFPGLALVDNAFEDLTHPLQLRQLEIVKDVSHLPLTIKASMHEVPSCRTHSGLSEMSQQSAVTYSVL